MWPSTRRSNAAHFIALSAALHALVLWHLYDAWPPATDQVMTTTLTVRLQPEASSGAEHASNAPSASSHCCKSGALAAKVDQNEKIAATTASMRETGQRMERLRRAPLLHESSPVDPEPESRQPIHSEESVAPAGAGSTEILMAAAPASGEFSTSDEPQNDTSPDTRSALTAIRDLVDQLKAYPLLARRRGWEGYVLLGFVIAANGDIRNVHVARSSGNAVLDQSALRALNQVRRVPDGLWIDGHSVDLQLPVIFRLTQS